MLHIRRLIDTAAGAHGLPAALVCAVVQVESAGNPWATRFEPAFLARYVPAAPKVFGAASRETERQGQATSWGLMQIMGLVARERGFVAPFFSELCAPETGLEFGCRQLAHFRLRFFERYGWEGVVAAYNAGSPRRLTDGQWVNQAYVDKIRRAGGLP